MDESSPKQGVKPDWERIGAEYRAGQLSLRDIGRVYGVSESAIRKKARKQGWKRDLSQQVQQQIRAELVHFESSPEPRTDREIVAAAAARGVEVIRNHREHLGKLYRISSRMAKDLEEYVAGLAPRPLWLGEKSSVFEALHKLASATFRWIPLERKAFNLDEEDERNVKKLTDEQVRDRIDELLRRRGAAGTARGAEPAMGEGEA